MKEQLDSSVTLRYRNELPTLSILERAYILPLCLKVIECLT
jgi:hypothetical protein